MNTTARERLVDAYFDALDEPDYDAFREVFVDNGIYRYPDVGPIEGVDEVIRGEQVFEGMYDSSNN